MSRPTWRHDPLARAVRLLDASPRRVVGAVVLGSLALGSAVALAAVSAWLIARASQMPPVLTLSVATVAVRAFGISRGVFRYLERLASHEVALRGMASLRTTTYERLASGRLDAVAGLRRGDLLARVGADVDSVGDVVVRALIPAGVAAVVGAGSVVLVGAFLPPAALVLLVCLLVASIASPWLTARATRSSEARTARARATMADAALHVLEDSAALRVAGDLDTELARMRGADTELARATDRGARPLAVSAALANVAVGTAAIAALLLGIPAVLAGTLAPEELAVVVLTPLAAFEASAVLPAAAVQVQRSREAAVRIMEILDACAPEGEGQARVPGDAARAPGATRPAVRARDLTVGWPGRSAVLAGLDVDVAPGRVVALVGPSGVGKTTSLLTLAGLVPPLAGELDTVRADVAVTPEDAHVFRTSVLENLRVARGTVTEREALDALDAVGLTGWLAALPDGLATDLGHGGATVSGGERRRLLLARALLSDAPIVAIDEPAEHMDDAAARGLTAHVLPRLLAQGRGVVLATHRLHGLEIADEVLVLEPGVPGSPGSERPPARVARRGTHGFLLDHDPAYRGAYDREDTPPGEQRHGSA